MDTLSSAIERVVSSIPSKRGKTVLVLSDAPILRASDRTDILRFAECRPWDPEAVHTPGGGSVVVFHAPYSPAPLACDSDQVCYREHASAAETMRCRIFHNVDSVLGRVDAVVWARALRSWTASGLNTIVEQALMQAVFDGHLADYVKFDQVSGEIVRPRIAVASS
ncbi:MAG: hypothetical protein WC732_08595 [Candidatus Omnitrophota bacterium]